MGFDSGSVVEPLDFDLSKHGGPKGTVPEPSDRLVFRFTAQFRKVVLASISEAEKIAVEQDVPEDDDARKERLSKFSLRDALGILDTADNETLKMLSDKMCGMVAEVCSNTPSEEQLVALPWRIKAAFFGWVVGELLVPEGSAAVTTPSLKVVSGG